MRIVLQRVKKANVTVAGSVTGSIDSGILILLGIHKNDTAAQADVLVKKCADLRIFSDAEGKMNLSLVDITGSALVVSQFTLYGDCRKGKRPSFTDAADPNKGRSLYTYFVEKMKALGVYVETGIFGALMDVELVNDGPVTMILDADNQDVK